MQDANHSYTQNELPAEVFNAGSGNGGNIVNFNGQAVQVYNNGNGTRKLVPQGSWDQYQGQQQSKQAQATYQQGIGSAVSTLQGQKTDLNTQYKGLLDSIMGTQQEAAVNQTTMGENNLLASRGITNNSPTYNTQMGLAQQPIRAQYQGMGSSLAFTEAGLQNTLATNIAGIQQSGAQFSAGLPLSYGSLALASAANIANISLAGSQGAQAGAQARYIPIPNVGLWDTQTGQFTGGVTNNNLTTGGYSILNVK